MSQADLARASGVTPRYVNDLVSGRTGVTLRYAGQLRDCMGLSPAWLLWGQGPQEAERAEELLSDERLAVLEAVEAVQAADSPEESDTATGALADAVGEFIARYRSRPGQLRIPVVARVAADAGSRIAWEPIDPPEWMAFPPGSVAARVEGDSMRPLARKGQTAVFAPRQPDHGDPALVKLRDGRAFFKRVWKFKDEWVLESDNPSEPEEPVRVRPRDVAEAMVWIATAAIY